MSAKGDGTPGMQGTGKIFCLAPSRSGSAGRFNLIASRSSRLRPAEDSSVSSGVGHKKVRALFRNHDRRSICVSGDNSRHDRGVDHPEAIEPMDPKLRINNGIGPHPHPAGAHGMKQRKCRFSTMLHKIFF